MYTDFKQFFDVVTEEKFTTKHDQESPCVLGVNF